MPKNDLVDLALVYDRVNARGGAEEILLALHNLVPSAPLYTSVYDRDAAGWIPRSLQLKGSFLQRLPFLRKRHYLIPWIMPLVFRTLDPKANKGVISITSEFAKGVRVRNATHISYLLTPTRYLWSHRESYSIYIRSRYGLWVQVIWRVMVEILRPIDLWLAREPKVMVAISKLVAERVATIYGRTIDAVIYPPVNTAFFSREKLSSTKRGSEPYLLWVGRLVPYKRLDLVVQASLKLKIPLYVVGTGEQQDWISEQSRLHTSIKYLGNLSERKKRQLLFEAACFVQPGLEDFGIAPVEAVAMGTPVVIHARSGAAEVLPEADCGEYVESETVEAVRTAIARVLKKQSAGKYRYQIMRRYAQECDTVKFTQHWKELLCKTIGMC